MLIIFMLANDCVLLQSEPYLRVVKGSSGPVLQGFIPDLVHMLSRRLGFTYDLRLLPSPMHGYYDSDTKSWTGLIGKLVKKEVVVKFKVF